MTSGSARGGSPVGIPCRADIFLDPSARLDTETRSPAMTFSGTPLYGKADHQRSCPGISADNGTRRPTESIGGLRPLTGGDSTVHS